MRASWDLWAQSILHLIIVPLFLMSVILTPHHTKWTFGKLAVVLFITAVISYLFSVDKYVSRSELFVLFDCIAVGFIVSSFTSKEREKLYNIPIFIGLFLSFVLAGYFFRDPIKYFRYDPITLIELFVNFNVIAGYLICAFGLAIGFVLTSVDEKRKCYLFLSSVLFIGLLLTKSRAALIAVIGIFLFLILFKLKTKFKNLFLIILIALICFFIFLVFFKIKLYRPWETGILPNQISWWIAGIKMFLANSLVGVGIGNFGNLYPMYKLGKELNTMYAHNIFIQISSELGIIGLLSFLWIICLFLKTVLFEYRNQHKISGPSLGIIAFLTVNIFGFSYFIPANMILFWAMLGDYSKKTVKELYLLQTIKSSVKTVLWCILVFLIFLWIFLVVNIFVANREFAMGEYQYNIKNYNVALQHFNKSLKYDKTNPQVYYYQTKIYQHYYGKE